MKHITLVCATGKRLFWKADYDKLCANGEAQARLLGKYWLRGHDFSQTLYGGPAFAATGDGADRAEVFRNAGHSFPEIAVMSEFDEIFKPRPLCALAFHN